MIVRERKNDIVCSPAWVKKIVDSLLESFDECERDKERFMVFGLDTRNKVKYVDVVSVGTLNYNLVHPREVFRPAIMRGVAAIIVAHNHPSGSNEASDEDRALTKRLVKAGKLLGIEVLDHVVVGEGLTSFKLMGWI